MELENKKLSNKAVRDYELVKKALEHNDQSAYTKLMEFYKDSIYFMLLKMTNNTDDAEDLTIEAFGKAFNNIALYTPDYAFSTWLFRIASNNCIDFLRKQKRKATMSIDNIKDTEIAHKVLNSIEANTLDPEEEIIKQQKIEIIRMVVDKLKPHYKLLIELRYFKEYSYEEISQELNIPLGTVKAKLFRARNLLYGIIKNSQENI